jgi:hypothetical protein
MLAVMDVRHAHQIKCVGQRVNCFVQIDIEFRHSITSMTSVGQHTVIISAGKDEGQI